MPRQCVRLHMTRFLFSSRSDVLFLHVCQSKNAIAAIALQERPNVGTLGYHCTELPVPTDWNSCFKPLEPFVTTTMNCWFPEIELMLSKQRNCRFAISNNCHLQTLELTRPNLGTIGYHCEEPSVPKGWNSRFPTL